MQEELANLVHPVLSYALDLRSRVERGEAPSLELEQVALKNLLRSDQDANRWVEYGGEMDTGSLSSAPQAPGVPPFLGIRYALTCWLDDLFIVHSPWESAWNERKMEVALYGTNDRAWRFWEQARLAENRATTDALEAFFLCVMLGFRGEMGEHPERLRAWSRSVQGKLTGMGEDWPHPPELDPPTQVPPLYGRDRFRSAVFWTCLILLFFLPVASFLLAQQFSE